MGYLLAMPLLFAVALSKSESATGLKVAEWLLLVSGLILLWGAVGEYLEDHGKLHRLPRGLQWTKLVFILMVVSGLIGEFIGDAGVFVFSEELQSIEDQELTTLGDTAALLEKRLKSVSDSADSALDKSGNAISSSTKALTVATGARKEADSFESDIKIAKKQANEAESHLAEAVSMAKAEEAELTRLSAVIAPRIIRPEQLERIRIKLKAMGPHEYALWISPDLDSWSVMASLRSALEGAEWKSTAPSTISIGPAGIMVTDRVRIGAASTKLTELRPIVEAVIGALTAEGIDAIGPVTGSEFDAHPNAIHIIIGAKHQDR